MKLFCPWGPVYKDLACERAALRKPPGQSVEEGGLAAAYRMEGEKANFALAKSDIYPLDRRLDMHGARWI